MITVTEMTGDAGEVVYRIVESDLGWSMKQVKQADGTWWNMTVERVK